MRIFTQVALAVFLAVLGSLSAFALPTHLCLTFQDESVVYLNLTVDDNPDAAPVLTISESKLNFVVPVVGGETQSYEYEAENLREITFVERDLSAVTETFAEGQVVITPSGDGLVRISGALSDSVNVYDLNGRKVGVEVSRDGESLVVSLRSLATGIYIVNYGSVTLKVTKK